MPRRTRCQRPRPSGMTSSHLLLTYGRKGICLLVCASILSTATALGLQRTPRPTERRVSDHECVLGCQGRRLIRLAERDHDSSVCFAETYRERDIWFGVLYTDYVINASTTLSLAFKSRDPVQKVTNLFAEMLMSKIASRQQTALSAARKDELTKFITETQAAETANARVKANNAKNLFTWTNSIRTNPIATLKNVVQHAFQSGLRGVSGIAEWELNQACFGIAHRSWNILPLTSVFPGGVLGKIMQTMSKSYIIFFHPVLASYKGVVSLSLALLCKLGFPKIVAAIFSRIFRAKRRLGRAITSLWRKYIGMRHDIAGNTLIGDMMRGAGVVMITLLFQLHAVDVDSITRRGEVVEGAMMAGQGAWALSDGLFVGLKDFGQLFSAYFNKYITVSKDILFFCKNGEIVSLATQDSLDFFFNGPNQGDLSPTDRLLEWYMVKTLQHEFRAFEEYLSNIMSIFYELTFATLESDFASTVKGGFGRPVYKGEIEALLKRQQQTSPLTKESEIPRALFRKPWMKKAIRSLAHGYFTAAAALTLLNHLNLPPPRYKDVERAAAYSRGNQWLLVAAKQTRSALAIIFGRFLNSQAVITRAKGLKSRMRVYDFINQCQEPKDPKYASVCGDHVTTVIDESKFVAKSLLALNIGVAGDARDLALTTVLKEEPSFDPTVVFAGWSQWMTDQGFSPSRYADYFAVADDVINTNRIEHFVKVFAMTLQERLRFYRFEPEGSVGLRLFDLNGRSATFRPRSTAALLENMKGMKPDPLDAPSYFRVILFNEGELIFAQAPKLPLKGFLIYADDRRELRALEHDPIAAKELLVSQLISTRGRLGAELIATLLMALHRKTPSFHGHSLLTFLNNVTPKMFMDGINILSDATELSEQGVALERGLYSFPQSFETFKDIFFSSLNTMVSRMHALDSSDSLSIFVVGLLHYAYQKVQKNRTGRTKVLEQFQRALLHVMEAAEAGKFEATFPECSFLTPADGESEEVLFPKCAMYRFLKLRSLDSRKDSCISWLQATEEEMNAARVILYVNAAIEYLDRLRGGTTWKEFLNCEGFRGSASQYAETVGKYTYEDLQLQMSGDISGEGDVLGKLRRLVHPSLGMITRPGSTEGTAQVVETLISGLSGLGTKAKKTVKNALTKLKGRLKKLLAHRKLPKRFRVYNTISGGHFFGALEHAERKAFSQSGKLPPDFISATDLAIFGKLLISVERTGLFLENPKAMSAIVSEMRTIPFVTPESEELYDEIREKIGTMKKADLSAAVGYLLSYNVAQGTMGVNVALAMLALKGVRITTTRITRVEKAGVLKVLEPEILRFLRRSLDMPLIFAHMKAIPDTEALTFFRFRPRGSISIAYPATSRTLPITETFEVAHAFDRLSGTGLLQAVAAEQGKPDNEAGCVALFARVQEALNLNFVRAFKLWSHEPGTYDKRMIAACAFFFVLKELLDSGQRESTVQALLEKVYFAGMPVSQYVDFVGSTGANDVERLKQLNKINPVVSLVYAVVAGGGLDVLWKGYSPETGHLHFQFRSASRISDKPLYDLFVHATEYVLESTNTPPEFFLLELESYYLEEWLRFVEPARVKQYVEDFKKTGSHRNINKEDLKHLSSVYVHYDLGDYFLSMRQRSVVPVADVVKSAANALLNQSERTLETYGFAMMMLDLSREMKDVKAACYAEALQDYKDFTHKSREDQEMWKIDCAHQHLVNRGSLGYSAGVLTVEAKHAVLEALDTELKVRGEALYKALVDYDVDIEKLKQQVWTFITMPHISLGSGTRLKEVVRIVYHFIKSVRQRAPWNSVASDLATRRVNKTLCRPPDAGKRYIYSSVERPYLFNPFQFFLDLLTFVKTNKAQSIRLPKVLLVKRLRILARLPFLRKRKPPGAAAYAKDLENERKTLLNA